MELLTSGYVRGSPNVRTEPLRWDLPLGLPWFVIQISPMQEDNRWLCREPCTLKVFRPVLYCSPEAVQIAWPCLSACSG